MEKMIYTRQDYVNALNYFGYKRSHAEIIVENRENTRTLSRLNYLVREYLKHMEE